MDAPLLALTRVPRASFTGLSAKSAAAGNMRQLVQLRWIAVAGQTATILLVHFALGAALPLAEMLAVVAALAVVNLLSMAALPRHRVRRVEIMLALLLDMGSLTLQLYFSGGATNPFVALYLLQVVLGAILLPPAATTVLLAAAAASYALLSFAYRPLVLPVSFIVERGDLFRIGQWIAFTMVAVLLVMFITRITRNLRARDAHLANLRQHAVEEDGIVRMGLFATGAAHELGTPLGTLSVILADWRRMPAIARDPGLAAEVAEMEGEVGRCKAIVSAILQSAGQPRSEAIQRAPAAAFAADAADSWQSTQPGVPLTREIAVPDGAVIPTDPALRQAIWNLLDNAAEVSPTGIAIVVGTTGPMLTIAVRDHGPGFAADTLAHVGDARRSTKEEGHGLGLFLAATVARRLGGRLDAANRTGGGAEVRLHLPFALPVEENLP